MSILYDPAIVRTRCHARTKRKTKLAVDQDGPVAQTPPWSLSRLKSISVPSLSVVVRSSLAWAGDKSWYMGSNEALPNSQRMHTDKESRRQILYLRMRNAVSFNDWKDCAYELDELEDNNTWKETFESSEYNPRLVNQRLKELEEAQISCDTSKMLYLIRTSLSRDLGDMSNAALYKHSHSGTKVLVDRYITTAVNTISALVDLSVNSRNDGPEMRRILDQLLETRQAFGRSALLLSGGGTFGMCHVGVIKSLWEARLLPRIISGASAGSVVSAICCCHTEDELPTVIAGFLTVDMHVFNEPDKAEGVLQKVSRFLKYGSFMDITHLSGTMQEFLGNMTFQEAYNRTRRILNICVSCAGVYELPRLLNYITAPNVLIWSAVTVSCSVPFVFTPPVLMAKDPITGEAVPWNGLHKHYIDGSVDGDLPMNRLSEMFNVNHFIVSQVNPHVAPFLPKEDGLDETASGNLYASWLRWVSPLTDLARDELLYRLSWAADMGIFPNALTKAASVVNQKYSGDINIYPSLSYSDLPFILQNPTVDFMRRASASGERATWPRLGRIRNHCAIELALDSAIRQMRAKVNFNSSQRELRLVDVPHHATGPINHGEIASKRRSSCSRSLEQTKHVEQDPTFSGGRPILRRAHSSVSPEQLCTVHLTRKNDTGPNNLPRHASLGRQPCLGLMDGPHSLPTGREKPALDTLLERPAIIQRLATWGPSSHDHANVKLTAQSTLSTYDSSLFPRSRRSSMNTGDRPTFSASEGSLSKHSLQARSTSNTQIHRLQMTSNKLGGPPDLSARNNYHLQTCHGG